MTALRSETALSSETRFRRAAPGALLAAILVFLASPATAIDVQRIVSQGGIEAWLVEDHSLPIISLSLSFRGGASVDPEGREGLGGMVSSLIDEGAGDITSERYQQILQDNSITLRFDAYLDAFTGSVKTLTRNRDQTFELLRLALTEPRFDREPVERIRSQIQTMLARQLNSPNSMVGRAFWEHLFPEHPYGRPRGGTEATVAAITAADLHDYVDRRFARDVLVLGVVGDITGDELAVLLDQTFGGLPATSSPIAVVDREPMAQGATIIVEHDIPQSIVAFGHRGIARDHPDYYAAYLLNHILGGGSFTSRLYSSVREERGLAYSIGTSLTSLDHSALWTGSVGTANADVGESIELIRREWAEIRANGVTPEELADTKTNVTGAFALGLDSTSSIARVLVNLQTEDLGIDYIDRRTEYIGSVTLEDITRVAREFLDPDSLTVVIVGRPEGVQATR